MLKKLTTILFLILAGVQMALAGIVKGIVTDAATGEPLIGATVTYANGRGTNTDVEGRFTLQIPKGRYTLTARYIGYKNATLQIVVTNATQEVTLSLEEDETALGTVTVTAEARRNTAAAMAREQQEAHVSLINVSEQQIRRTQDKDAGEVIRRIPGISIIDDRYVMVRGLSQRYNNVWMNGAAVPSSEADQRAFSFDIIPSSQISNMKVVRSAAPEYPADYTGGFIVINTKDVPTTDTWSISVGSGINSVTHFDRRQTYAGSGTDFLGFDNGLRTLDHGIHTALTPQGNGYALLGNGLNNDWTVKARRPLPDISLSGTLSKRWQTAAGQTWGLNAGMNYSNTTRTLDVIQNNLFGAYDRTPTSRTTCAAPTTTRARTTCASAPCWAWYGSRPTTPTASNSSNSSTRWARTDTPTAEAMMRRATTWSRPNTTTKVVLPTTWACRAVTTSAWTTCSTGTWATPMPTATSPTADATPSMVRKTAPWR